MDNTETPLINDNASGRDRYAGFMELLNQNFNDQSRAAIMEAFDIAYRSLDGMKRYDGSPIFDHSIRTAGIVISDIGLGRNSTISTLLHDVARLGLINAEQIEEKFGVVAAAAVAAPAAEEAAPTGPSEVTVTLTDVGGTKVAVIKAVREITGLGLVDAKKLVDGAPAAIKENISPEEADQIKEKLVAAGATVEVK